VDFCPKHYGVCLYEPYEEWREDQNATSVVKNPLTKRDVVPDQITWLARKGDSIIPGYPLEVSTPLQVRVSTTQYRSGVSMRVTFVSTSLSQAPNNISHFKKGKKAAF
jgi:hypothetical protein